MANITVTAGNGSRAKVRVQEVEEHTHQIPAIRNTAGELLAPERVEKYQSFVDKRIDQFASEARTYDVAPNQRLIVEENPA